MGADCCGGVFEEEEGRGVCLISCWGFLAHSACFPFFYGFLKDLEMQVDIVSPSHVLHWLRRVAAFIRTCIFAGLHFEGRKSEWTLVKWSS